MKAFVLERYGKQRALRLADLPRPELRADEVLVEVHAAGVNLLDAKIRNGEFKPILPYRLPLVLGHDVAGVVVEVGPQVSQFKIGDEVYARADDFRIGSFAEFVPVKESSVAPKPAGLSMVEAASIPLVGLTAWQALVERGGLQRGQKVFIQAGSGGVGTFAIQLAKHLGASVATTAGAASAQAMHKLGADLAIDYRTQDFEALLRGYDLVLHSQDGKALEKSLLVLRPGGKLISISGPPDPAFAKGSKAPGIAPRTRAPTPRWRFSAAMGRGCGRSPMSWRRAATTSASKALRPGRWRPCCRQRSNRVRSTATMPSSASLPPSLKRCAVFGTVGGTTGLRPCSHGSTGNSRTSMPRWANWCALRRVCCRPQATCKKTPAAPVFSPRPPSMNGSRCTCATRRRRK